jgi:hypothetical protein
MIGFLAGMASAALKVAATPVTVVIDVLSMPLTCDGTHDHPMIRTEAALRSAARDFNEAIES